MPSHVCLLANRNDYSQLFGPRWSSEVPRFASNLGFSPLVPQKASSSNDTPSISLPTVTTVVESEPQPLPSIAEPCPRVIKKQNLQVVNPKQASSLRCSNTTKIHSVVFPKSHCEIMESPLVFFTRILSNV